MTIWGWKRSKNNRGIQTLNGHFQPLGQSWALDWIGSRFIRVYKSKRLLFGVLDRSWDVKRINTQSEYAFLSLSFFFSLWIITHDIFIVSNNRTCNIACITSTNHIVTYVFLVFILSYKFAIYHSIIIAWLETLLTTPPHIDEHNCGDPCI